MRPKKFPPAKPWHLRMAQCQVADVATWAKRMGFHNVAERLEWASLVLREHIDAEDMKSRPTTD